MNKGWFRWGVVPFFLMFASLFFVLIFVYSSKSYILIQKLDKDVLTHWKPDEIIAKQKVSGEFIATSDFMGILSMRFNTFTRINSDSLIFRIKEKGDTKWYYENFYKVDQFQPNQLFPFGFPPLQDSRGQRYQFEVESTKGKHQDAVAVGSESPVITVSYQLPASKLLSGEGMIFLTTHKERIITFIIDAITTRAENLIILFLPLTLYLTLMSWRTSRLFETFVNIVCTALLGYIFLIGRFLPGTQQNNTAFVLLLLLLVVFSVRKFKVSYTIYYILAIFFILLMLGILVILRRPDIADRSALFAYLFLIIGTGLGIVDPRTKKGEKKLSVFFRNLWIINLLLWISYRFSTRFSFYNKLYTRFIYEIRKTI